MDEYTKDLVRKTILEMDTAIKEHKERDNTFTFSILEQAKKYMQMFLDEADRTDWIPCGERLPDIPEENPYLDNKRLEMYLVDVGVKYPIRAFWNGKAFTDGWVEWNAIAWMPLPEPYKHEKK